MQDIFDSDFYRQLPEDVQTVFSMLRNKYNLKPGKVRLFAHEWGPFMERKKFAEALRELEEHSMIKMEDNCCILPVRNEEFRLRLEGEVS